MARWREEPATWRWLNARVVGATKLSQPLNPEQAKLDTIGFWRFRVELEPAALKVLHRTQPVDHLFGQSRPQRIAKDR